MERIEYIITDRNGTEMPPTESRILTEAAIADGLHVIGHKESVT